MVEIDKKLNVYFIHKETGEIYWNNIMFGNVREVGAGCAVVFPIELSTNLSKNAGIPIDPYDYHVILAMALEIIGYEFPIDISAYKKIRKHYLMIGEE